MGYNDGGRLENLYFEGYLSGGIGVGGLVGVNDGPVESSATEVLS